MATILQFIAFCVLIQSCVCMLKPVYVENQGRRVFFDVGKTLSLSCQVTGSDENASEIKWRKAEMDNLDENQVKVDGKTSTLKLEKTEGTEHGMYFCSYKGDEHPFDVIANILVKIKPSTDVSVVEGETLSLKCAGVGTKLRINWVFDANITEHVTYKDSDGLENNTLEIHNMDKKYRGNFTCEGRHDDSLDLDNVVFSTAYVRVKDKYAALWPFVLICIEVFILCAIILIYEKHRTHVEVEDSETEPDQKNGKN
ncbi:basigin [Culicoides brevitarsis]|uniref:basigin n=1 Tax=Culicoides brevitarsis TaxID=469753 RepID=UPI00307B5A1C